MVIRLQDPVIGLLRSKHSKDVQWMALVMLVGQHVTHVNVNERKGFDVFVCERRNSI